MNYESSATTRSIVHKSDGKRGLIYSDSKGDIIIQMNTQLKGIRNMS